MHRTGAREARWAAVDRPLMAGAIYAAARGRRSPRAAVGIRAREPSTQAGRAPSAGSGAPDERPRASAASRPRASTREPRGSTLAFLRRHADAQRASSPFETEGERVEISAETLASLRDHVLGREPTSLGPVTVALVEDAAEVLRAQNEVPWTFEFIGPIAARSAEPWPALERALAWRDAGAAPRGRRPAAGSPRARRAPRRGPTRTGGSLGELGRGAEAGSCPAAPPRRAGGPRPGGRPGRGFVVAGDPRGAVSRPSCSRTIHSTAGSWPSRAGCAPRPGRRAASLDGR